MKTYISDSLISETLILLEAMKKYNSFEVEQVENIRTYYGINKKVSLSFAKQCAWIVLINENTYALTPYGDELLEQFNGMEVQPCLYRDILRKYIITCCPAWAKRIPYGRNEAYRIMTDEEQLCFKKAGLMITPVTRAEVDWWDSLADLERQKIEQLQDDIGRKGEELTVAYEKNRTKVDPIWESIDSNLVGYDILSQVSCADTRKILIEVKSSSKKIENAALYISYNEWNFASAGCNQDRYFFYIWHLATNPSLAIIPYSKMAQHIPFNNGRGEWKEVSVPFSAFQSDFRDN